MKLFKKAFSLLSVAALCMGFFFSNSLTASAAEPTTYYLKYVSANSDWRYQVGEWKTDEYFCASSTVWSVEPVSTRTISKP